MTRMRPYSSRRTVKEDTLGWLDANGLEDLAVCDGEHDGLLHLTKLLRETTNVRVLLLGLLVDLHGLDAGIILRRKLVQNQVAVLVDTNEISRLEIVRSDKTNNG